MFHTATMPLHAVEKAPDSAAPAPVRVRRAALRRVFGGVRWAFDVVDDGVLGLASIARRRRGGVFQDDAEQPRATASPTN